MTAGKLTATVFSMVFMGEGADSMRWHEPQEMTFVPAS